MKFPWRRIKVLLEQLFFIATFIFFFFESIQSLYYSFLLNAMTGESITAVQIVKPGGKLIISRKVVGEPNGCIVESIRTIIPVNSPSVRIRPENHYNKRITTGEAVRLVHYTVEIPDWLMPGDYYFQGSAVYTCHILHSLFGAYQYQVQAILFKVEK